MKKFTKIVFVVIAAIMMMSSFSACTKRENTLKIYNWGDYMDESVISGFEEWYLDKTGEEVKLVYKTFDTNETMYASAVTQEKDWDLVCPSDYMIEKMIKEKKVQKIDTSIIDYVKDGTVDTYLIDIINSISKDASVKASDYTIPYVWGTFGIMYNSDEVTKEEASSWSILWSDKYKKEIYMKDSVRDSYAVASLYANAETLSAASNGFTDYTTTAYKQELDKIFKVYDTVSITAAKEALLKQKPNLKKYEVDDGKTEMHAGNGKLGLFWSCDAGFVMNDYESEGNGCAGASTLKGNKKLFYEVPKEGSNVWIDGWMIPNGAKNAKAANYFLKYLMEEEQSILNAKYAGAPTPNKTAMAKYKAELEKDEDGYFTGAPNGFREMYMEMMFPPQSVLERCGVMGDFGDKYPELNSMWVAVKSAKT